MLRFYMDHHVHGGITAGLRARGVDWLTLQEDGAERFDDEAVLRRATELDRVLVTQDEDFLVISARWQHARHDFSGIVFSDQLGITVGEAVRDLELIARGKRRRNAEHCGEDSDLTPPHRRPSRVRSAPSTGLRTGNRSPGSVTPGRGIRAGAAPHPARWHPPELMPASKHGAS